VGNIRVIKKMVRNGPPKLETVFIVMM